MVNQKGGLPNKSGSEGGERKGGEKGGGRGEKVEEGS